MTLSTSIKTSFAMNSKPNPLLSAMMKISSPLDLSMALVGSTLLQKYLWFLLNSRNLTGLKKNNIGRTAMPGFRISSFLKIGKIWLWLLTIIVFISTRWIALKSTANCCSFSKATRAYFIQGKGDPYRLFDQFAFFDFEQCGPGALLLGCSQWGTNQKQWKFQEWSLVSFLFRTNWNHSVGWPV